MNSKIVVSMTTTIVLALSASANNAQAMQWYISTHHSDRCAPAPWRFPNPEAYHQVFRREGHMVELRIFEAPDDKGNWITIENVHDLNTDKSVTMYSSLEGCEFAKRITRSGRN